MGFAPLLLRPAPLFGVSRLFASPGDPKNQQAPFPFADNRLFPHYPVQSPLADVLKLVTPGSDRFMTELYAFEIESALKRWIDGLKSLPRDHSALAEFVDDAIQAVPFSDVKETKVRSAFGIDVVRREFATKPVTGRKNLLKEIDSWLGPLAHVDTAEFEVFGVQETVSAPLTVRVDARYDLVARRRDGSREERVGSWSMVWSRETSQPWKALRWEAGEETLSVVHGPAFIDVTTQAIGQTESYAKQLAHGADYWRTVLDGAIGVDVYGNNGVAAGDFDNDGFDDFYVCQPAGLPNRLYRNRGDGTFEDVTQKAGVGVLDNTACALFADFDNKGRQDLLVVCGTGPLLFQNQGNGTFVLKRDAFKFAREPQGTFTHAAIADYDRDGRLDIYFCMYMYYLGLDQYHYPIPYYDARNGPPNCLLHNEGNGNFVESTEAAGLNADNDRYSFAAPGATPIPMDSRICLSPMTSEARNSTATMAMGRSPLCRRRHRLKAWAPAWVAAGPISITTADKTFMFPACGRPRGNGFQNKSNFMKTRRNVFANSISGMRAAMRFIATAATGHL